MNDLCRQYQEVYGDPSMPEELIRHGESCGACREFTRCQQSLQQALPSWTTPEFSPDFALSVMSRVAEDGSKKRTVIDILRELFQTRFTIPLPVGALASILLVISLAMNFAFWPGGQAVIQAPPNQFTSSSNNTSMFTTNPLNKVTPLAIPAGQGNTPRMIDGSLIVPGEFLGAGAFLLVPIIEPNPPAGLIRQDSDPKPGQTRGI